MEAENETFWPNIRRYLSLPASKRATTPAPKPECTICLASTLKCYPVNNHGNLASKCSKTGADLERMAILYCGHVVGYDCITSYLATCYYNHQESESDLDLPRCPQCREQLTKDCERPYLEGDEDQVGYHFMIPFVVAPAGPPIPGQPDENFDEDSPVHFNILDEGNFRPIAYSHNRWKDIPLTRPEGGLLPASCRCCDPGIYRRMFLEYRAQQMGSFAERQQQQQQEGKVVKMVMNNTLYPTKGAPRLVPHPSSVFEAPPNRPRHNIWRLGFCVVAEVPCEDGSNLWEWRRMRVATRVMYQARLMNGMSVEIPLEPRCLGPPQWGPIRFGRHPLVPP